MKKKILVVFGTRPEAIKLAPVIIALEKEEIFELKVCVTSQHIELLQQVLQTFNITPDFDLSIMTVEQTLPKVVSNVLTGLTSVLEKVKPELVIVHGDTVTSFAASLAAFYQNVEIAHIEAGLRTHDLLFPWPEEANRQLTGVLAKHHFAPTECAKKNLLDEGKNINSIYVTGNTVVDALFMGLNKLKTDPELNNTITTKFATLKSKKIILVTCHRRENFGKRLKEICEALIEISKKHSDHQIVFPLHPNPQVLMPVKSILGGFSNILLLEALDYLSFIYLLDKCALVLTDSGGIQEEAPSLNKHVMVMRDETERVEAISSGAVTLVGTGTLRIVENVSLFLEKQHNPCKSDVFDNPFGDGHAAERIVIILKSLYGQNK